MGTIGIIIISLAIIGTYAIFHILIYNQIQTIKTKINHVEGIIDETLRQKYDTLIKLEEILKKNIKENKEYLKELKELKNQKISNFELHRKLNESQAIIENLFQDNQIKNTKIIKQNNLELKEYNQRLTAGINYYNKQITNFNNYIRKFPHNIIAKIHRLKIRTYFDGKDMEDNDTKEFKL